MRHKLSLSRSTAFLVSLARGTARFDRMSASVACLLALSACGPKFGDGCKTSTDCSVRNDRICDRAQPGGYCTISNCKPGDCGDDGVCVRFRPDEPRLSVTYCMAKCDNTRDCDRDAYVCRSAEQLKQELEMSNEAGEAADEGENFAEVLDGSGKAKFCIGKE
jgi:hypothetical protein